MATQQTDAIYPHFRATHRVLALYIATIVSDTSDTGHKGVHKGPYALCHQW